MFLVSQLSCDCLMLPTHPFLCVFVWCNTSPLVSAPTHSSPYLSPLQSPPIPHQWLELLQALVWLLAFVSQHFTPWCRVPTAGWHASPRAGRTPRCAHTGQGRRQPYRCRCCCPVRVSSPILCVHPCSDVVCSAFPSVRDASRPGPVPAVPGGWVLAPCNPTAGVEEWQGQLWLWGCRSGKD